MTTPGAIKNHIKAIRQTRQITGAMYLLSASRMRQTIKRIEYNLEYMQRLRATIKDIIIHTGGQIRHPYLNGRKHDNTCLFIVITGDKGLCGGYNTNLLHFAEEQMAKFTDKKKRLAVIGIVGEEHFRAKGIEPDYCWRGVIQNPAMYSARAMTDILVEEFENRGTDEVFVIFTHYKNAMQQEPVMMKLLPLSEGDFRDVSVEYEYKSDIIFEPSPEVVFQKLVPQFMVGSLFNALIQASTSEHASRMNAMQTATSNADEMIAKLEIEYNQTRQLQITNEITEIAAATESIKDKAI
ncbi:MAG: ATP synthase F1 subunit gamma [Ruminococcaceae bacterium]|nr:ATP synthase F1 subunit gamma [Oscillospiraceae bacterium]